MTKLPLQICVAGVVVALGLMVPAQAGAKTTTTDTFLTVVFSETMDIRQLAREHLGDSDLWPEILKASGIETIADLKPGQELKIPVSLIASAKQALDQSLEQIQKANEAGAQIFAPKEITSAISYRDEALVKQTAGAWSETLDLAQLSHNEASSALKVCVANRDQAAEARLSDRQGDVEGQRPRDLSWSERQLNSVLIEEEKVRTLSQSTAQITFRDASRLRLNANSQAVIQRMRHDPLSRREDAKVSLVEGDFYALLASDNSRKKFQVALPNVDASIESGNFWVKQENGAAQFANYDDRKVNITSKGETLELGRNEAAEVREGEKPSSKFTVLPAPGSLLPDENTIIYQSKVKLSWAAVDKSDGYWLEVASDPIFDRMVFSRWGLLTTTFSDETLKPGIYYWRVAALDSSGVPGPRTAARSFEVREDTVPPFLRINDPPVDIILRKAEVEVTGESEPETSVAVNGVPATVDPQGHYALRIQAEPGDNEIVVVATDPAGNSTTKKRSFSYMPDQTSDIVFAADIPRRSERHFLTNTKTLSLSGTTTADANILVQTAAGALRTTAYADNKGKFAFNVPLEAETEKLHIDIIAPSGFTSGSDFTATVDQSPPEIKLARPLPRLTSNTRLALRGTVDSGSTVTLNKAPVEITDGAFDVALDLKPGANFIQMVATDPVGNVKVEKWQVRLDREAPELVSHTLTQKPGGKGVVLAVEIFAKDASGLAKLAPYSLQAGDKAYPGFLRFNRATKSYQGTVEVPNDLVASAALDFVELKDGAGNKKRFSIQR